VVLVFAAALLGVTAACSSPPAASHAPTSTAAAHPTSTAPTTSETPATEPSTTTTLPAVVSEVDEGPGLSYVAVYSESISEADGKTQSDLLEAGALPSPRGPSYLTWFFQVSASSASDRYINGTWSLPGGIYICTRPQLAGGWKCDLYDGAPNGLSVIQLQDPQFGLAEEGLADIRDQPVAPAPIPVILSDAPSSWHLSCWRFSAIEVPVVTVCLTASRVIAYFNATGQLPSFGGPETIVLQSLSTDVGTSTFRLPAPVTGTTYG
jgi:hypothetical protein